MANTHFFTYNLYLGVKVTQNVAQNLLHNVTYAPVQGSKIALVRSYLRVSQAAGQVNILIFLLKIKFSPCMPINFVMQGKCLFSDISRPAVKFEVAMSSG